MGEKKLQIVALREYILGIEKLMEEPGRGIDHVDNAPYFKVDFLELKLKSYTGTFVAYQKGILVGQSKDGNLLYHEFSCLHGGSNLTVFGVPEDREFLDDAVKDAIEHDNYVSGK